MKTEPDIQNNGRCRPTARCDFCLGTSAANKQGLHEKMLFCKDCDAKAHPSCMQYSNLLATKALSYPWQCIECKTCSVCCSAKDGASILFCDACDKAYHMKCHIPAVGVKPEGKWICCSCTEEEPMHVNGWERSEVDAKTNHEVHSDGSSTCNFVPIDYSPSTIQANHALLPASASLPERNVPDSVDWTPAQVAEYFKSVGFPEQACVFIREEIDGRSLLLLRRADVISGLSLKLGPAVKIYEHITKLQGVSLSHTSYQNGIK